MARSKIPPERERQRQPRKPLARPERGLLQDAPARTKPQMRLLRRTQAGRIVPRRAETRRNRGRIDRGRHCGNRAKDEPRLRMGDPALLRAVAGRTLDAQIIAFVAAQKRHPKRARTIVAQFEGPQEPEIADLARAGLALGLKRLRDEVEISRPGQDRAPGANRIVIPAGPRLGNLVIEAEHLRKAYGNRLLIDDLDFKLPPGGIVGVIGPNGAGKTTLFRMITGQEVPDSGAIRVGETVKLAYVDQSRDDLEANKTVWEEISGGNDEIELGKRKMQSRAYVSLFNFRGSDQQKKVGQLSGGERNRVHLAKMLKSGGNVIMLDEPTNDLDVDTLRSLEEGLLEFAGCAVVISHDRWFLDRVATHILAFEGDSQVVWFEGNYQAYEEDRKRRLGAAADQPHRIKYKPISRN